MEERATRRQDAHRPAGDSAESRRRADSRALLALLVILPAGACALFLALARGSVGHDAVADVSIALTPTGGVTIRADAPTPERSTVRMPRAFTADTDHAIAKIDTARDVREQRGPRTEAEYLVELRALLGSDPDAFALRADSIEAGAGPACEQFALLRAAYEASWPGMNDLCARTASARDRAADPRVESVTQSLVHWLGERALREPRAREALGSIVWNTATPAEPIHRIRALRALVLAAPRADVALLAQRIQAEADPTVHSAGLAALDEREQPAVHADSTQEFP